MDTETTATANNITDDANDMTPSYTDRWNVIRAARTNELLNEIRALWPDGHISFSIHNLPVDFIRTVCTDARDFEPRKGAHEGFTTGTLDGLHLYS